MNTAVIVFPASNCDRDMASAVRLTSDRTPQMVWHQETSLPQDTDLVCLPGGFSYGDYLRCGAMAAQSPIMQAVMQHAQRGGYVLGVCNGFQILCESGLLPGALRRNSGQTFICQDTMLVVENTDSPFTQGYEKGQRISLPVAHHDGNYYADDATLQQLENDGCIAFRYGSNINGSCNDIAGILSDNNRILGMMPHPERAVDRDTMHGVEGHKLFHELLILNK